MMRNARSSADICKMKKLVTFGSHCMDHYQNPGGGVFFAGGGPVNMAVHARELGTNAEYAGAIGNDENGRYLLRQLKERNIPADHIHILEGKSAVCDVELRGNERILGDYDEGVLSSFVLPEEDITFIASADLAVSDLWGRQEDAFPAILSAGGHLAFDAADRPFDEITQKVVPYLDLLFFSSSEDDDSLRQIMRDFQNQGIGVVTAMRGEKGSVTLDQDGFHICGIHKTQIITDTMGAGDSYIAGFLHGYLNGYDTEKCMELGSREASETLGYYGAFRQEGRHE